MPKSWALQVWRWPPDGANTILKSWIGSLAGKTSDRFIAISNKWCAQNFQEFVNILKISSYRKQHWLVHNHFRRFRVCSPLFLINKAKKNLILKKNCISSWTHIANNFKVAEKGFLRLNKFRKCSVFNKKVSKLMDQVFL